jgi:hypothetical protein
MKPLIALLALAAASTAARAEEPPDVVVLTDGTIMQGRLAELKPDDHVTLVLLTGEPRTVDYAEIARMSGPSFPQSESAPGAGGQNPPRVTLTVEGGRERVAVDHHVVIGGDRSAAIAPPPLYLLPPSLTPPFARFQPPLGARRGFTYLMLALGPMLGGSIMTAVGARESEPMMSTLHDTFIGVGSTMLIAGTASLIAGIVLLSRGKHDRGPNASLAVGPSGLAVAGRF